MLLRDCLVEMPLVTPDDIFAILACLSGGFGSGHWNRPPVSPLQGSLQARKRHTRDRSFDWFGPLNETPGLRDCLVAMLLVMPDDILAILACLSGSFGLGHWTRPPALPLQGSLRARKRHTRDRSCPLRHAIKKYLIFVSVSWTAFEGVNFVVENVPRHCHFKGASGPEKDTLGQTGHIVSLDSMEPGSVESNQWQTQQALSVKHLNF
jgi:hypothetical protein